VNPKRLTCRKRSRRKASRFCLDLGTSNSRFSLLFLRSADGHSPSSLSSITSATAQCRQSRESSLASDLRPGRLDNLFHSSSPNSFSPSLSLDFQVPLLDDAPTLKLKILGGDSSDSFLSSFFLSLSFLLQSHSFTSTRALSFLPLPTSSSLSRSFIRVHQISTVS